MRILVVEDERNLLNVIRKRLEKEHYSTDGVGDGTEALEYIRQTDYDAVILDIMLPGMPGTEVLKTMRREGNRTPVLFLTARDAMEDRVRGLDLGADDYLVKPFGFEELLARIRVMIRRNSQSGELDNALHAGNLTMDIKTHQVHRGDVEIELSAREFQILEYLMRNKGCVLTREAIEAHVWNYDYIGGSNMIDVYIRYLRRKIDEGQEEKLIQTVRGKGYVLREKV
ncbi:response regulator transcription factor [Dorea sp. D27]|uniref:response regulator transcription factor n=1 Tax=Dorea sp. D27 TaxID=658665 RepID=UPI00067328CD|nr:response regulator transcription factor [Dorea sp. D27]KMZ54586.1 DNA-binding response regulator [Dorea sp. D27]